MTAYQPDGKSRTLRREADEALRLAVQGKWEEAVELNRRILEQAPRDVDALNRLGKALLELGRLADAQEAYQNTLTIDPGNTIARRNLVRLEQAASSAATAPATGTSTAVRARVFIEEVGKTYVTDLVRPAASNVLTRVAPADPVEIRPSGNQVEIYSIDGDRLGQLEPRIGQRLIKLLDMGNRYQAFVVALTGNTIRVILRETYRNPEAPEQASFPRQAKIAAPRPYLRDTGRLARELEPDLLLDSDEEEEEESEEEEVEGAEALDEEAEEDEDFIGDSRNLDEEEPSIDR